jgi:AcrR family transcriptional regulator
MTTTLSALRRADPFRVDARLAVCPDDHDARRARIVGCAARAFVTHGFDGANMEEIACAAGVSKVTIYRHFTGKADLFGAVLVGAVAEMAAPLAATLRLDRPVESVLVRFAECYLERMIRPGAAGVPFYAFAHALIAASRTQPELARSCTAILERDIAGPLTGYMQAKMRNGELRQGDAAFLSQHMMQMLFFTNRVAMMPSACPAPAELGGLARRVVGLFLHGCGG